MDSEVNIDRLRSYASILSNSTFNLIVREKNYNYLKSKIRKYDKDLPNKNSSTYQEYFTYIFNSLLLNYRNEYLYKNLIINEILFKRYNLSTTTVLNEFRINKSIADLVLINGTSRVYEIKTELDNDNRLLSQIDDYKKVFKEIYLVTYHSLADKYWEIIGKDIGLIVLTDNFTLHTIREAEINTDLDNISILKCLRKSEYTSIIMKYFGFLPQVSDFKFYTSCKELFSRIPSQKLHDLMIDELKKRTVREKDILSSPSVPDELKHICFCLDFDKKEYQVLNSVLNRRI